MELIASELKIRKSLSSLIEVFEKMINSKLHSYLSFRVLFEVLGNVCKQITNSKVSTHYPNIVKFYIGAFDLRVTLQDKITFKQCLKVEDVMMNSFIEFVLKLNEILFKPLFLKLHQWSSIDAQPYSANRKSFFFKLVDRLSSSLRVLMVPMFAYLLEDIVSILRNPNRILSNDKDEEEEDTEFNFDTSKLICTEATKYCIHSLGKCFEYNEENFVTKERFELLLSPLVSVLAYHQNPFLDYDTIIPSLVYCLGQLAVTTHNQLLWKPLQNQVLMQTRHDNPRVRYSALLVIREFYHQLGEEFLPMLPESIPFIAELIEDNNEEVEELCQEIVAEVDDFLGDEKIEDYL